MGLVDGPPRRRLRVAAVIDLPEGLPVDIEIDEPTRRTFEPTHRAARVAGSPRRAGHRRRSRAPSATTSSSYFELLAFLTTAPAKLSHGRHVQADAYSDFTRGMADGFRRDRGRASSAPRAYSAHPERLAEFFERYDVMLSPVTSTVAPPIGHLANDVPHRELLERVFAWIPFPPIANAAGTPSISLPLGWDDERRLPVGAMFGAATGQDAAAPAGRRAGAGPTVAHPRRGRSTVKTLQDRVAVVTIGRATSLALAGRGCHVAGAWTARRGGRETTVLIERLGRRATVHMVDSPATGCDGHALDDVSMRCARATCW